MAKTKIDNCWRKIGVWSVNNKTCPVLKEVIHCQNCDVYIQVGRQMLNRDAVTSAKEIMNRSKSYAQPLKIKTTGNEKVTIFRLGSEWFAIDTKLVKEVIEPRLVRWIPHLSGGLVEGMSNIGGDPVIIISLKKLLGIDEENKSTDKSKRRIYQRWLVIYDEKGALALLADEVSGTYRYLNSDIRDVPETVSKANITYVKGLVDFDTSVAGILDGDLLFYGIEQDLR